MQLNLEGSSVEEDGGPWGHSVEGHGGSPRS